MLKTTLSDITLNITDGKHGDCEGQDNSGFYFVSCKDVKDGVIDYINARQITEKDFSEADKRTDLQPDDILVTNSGTIGRMAFVTDNPLTRKTTFQKSVAIVRPNEEIVLPKYLYYQFQNCVDRFINQSNGAAQKNLLLSTMRAFEINIHKDKAVQKRVADTLSAYDDLIENNRKQIKLLEEAAQRLYEEWFVDLRFPGYEDIKIVDGIPEGWVEKTVAGFGEVITGKTPSTAKLEYYGNDVPFVTIPDMHNTVFPIKTEKHLSEEGANTQKGKYLPRSSLIVSCIATVGLVNITHCRCQTNQQINAVVLKDITDLYFLYFAMKGLKALLDGVGSNGATMTNVNKSKFGNIKIIYPNNGLNKRFFSICKPLFDKILVLEKEIVVLEQARDRLLPKLMNGKFEV